MKRIIAVATFAILSIGCFAQDLIVKRDGSIIQAKVSEIGMSEVKYKKWSNQDGPSYIIPKNEVLAINYQNGEKETFEMTNVPAPTNIVSDELSEEAKASNSKAIETWNNSSLIYKGKEGKSASCTFWAWGIDSESVLCNDDVEISFATCYQDHHHEPGGIETFSWGYQNYKNYWPAQPGVGVYVKNKTDKVLFFDLGSSTFTRNGVSSVIYDNTVTTYGSGSSSGGSVGLGILPGLSLGLGGGSSDMTTTTTREERIVPVSPHSSMMVCRKPIFPVDMSRFKAGGYYSPTSDAAFRFVIMRPKLAGTTPVHPYCNIENNADIKTGSSFKYNQENSPMKFSIYLTYSNDQNFTSSKHICTNAYVKEVMGVHSDSAHPNSYLDNYRFGVVLKVLHDTKKPMIRLGE